MTDSEKQSILEKYIKSEGLRKHCFSVEDAMRFYSKKLDPANEEKWALVGLFHDIDWEAFPDDHPLKAPEILPKEGIEDSEVIHAILSHYEEKTGVKPESLMEKCLLACDELTGLITAASLMRPNGISDLGYSSIKKKMKSKGFARGVDREIVQSAFEDFSNSLPEPIEFSAHVENVIEAMRSDERLGL
ncbi:hypothetical protein KC660_02055 [Candidatus Dojkabacteria bacterium]|uniref:HD domain-containing protein n=1 Tax=Candidatus Dojkabacteria bacterium TaxID=2099670 RepID=A0A955RIB9_9BACT|nr:hypothetical protein [Candidatus Dojkabacteria bacterium]